MPVYTNQVLGGKLERGQKTSHKGIDNLPIIAYRHRIKLYVGSHSIDTFADFSSKVNMFLLGREDFFKYFKCIIFNQDQKLVKLLY
jgi:hypothetical protein